MPLAEDIWDKNSAAVFYSYAPVGYMLELSVDADSITKLQASYLIHRVNLLVSGALAPYLFESDISWTERGNFSYDLGDIMSSRFHEKLEFRHLSNSGMGVQSWYIVLPTLGDQDSQIYREYDEAVQVVWEELKTIFSGVVAVSS